MYSVDTNMSHVPKHIKITFYQIVTEMQGSQKWQFDKIWFYKLLYDSLLNSLLQTWQLGKKLMPESSQGNPYLWLPHMKGSPHCQYEKADPPLALKNESPYLHGGEDTMWRYSRMDQVKYVEDSRWKIRGTSKF